MFMDMAMLVEQQVWREIKYVHGYGHVSKTKSKYGEKLENMFIDMVTLVEQQVNMERNQRMCSWIWPC